MQAPQETLSGKPTMIAAHDLTAQLEAKRQQLEAVTRRANQLREEIAALEQQAEANVR